MPETQFTVPVSNNRLFKNLKQPVKDCLEDRVWQNFAFGEKRILGCVEEMTFFIG